MNEYVFVTFIINVVERSSVDIYLRNLGDDYKPIGAEYCLSSLSGAIIPIERIKITGRIKSAAATVLKLQYPELADQMCLSYISDEMKDRYRK